MTRITTWYENAEFSHCDFSTTLELFKVKCIKTKIAKLLIAVRTSYENNGIRIPSLSLFASQRTFAKV